MRAQESTQPPRRDSTDVAMNKIKAIASEHFDDYVLIVTKDSNVWHTYNKKTAAFGMMTMIGQKIQQDWSCARSNDSAEE